jgi:sulfate transport system permease protein
MIITKLEQYDYAAPRRSPGDAAVLLHLLLIINGLQAWTAKRTGRDR